MEIGTQLRQELKRLIVETLKLDGVLPESITDDEPLFGQTTKLQLDSLNALEILSAIEFQYKIRFPNDESVPQHFRSIESLAAFVQSARG
jgi:acyl carrier protein